MTSENDDTWHQAVQDIEAHRRKSPATTAAASPEPQETVLPNSIAHALQALTETVHELYGSSNASGPPTAGTAPIRAEHDATPREILSSPPEQPLRTDGGFDASGFRFNDVRQSSFTHSAQGHPRSPVRPTWVQNRRCRRKKAPPQVRSSSTSRPNHGRQGRAQKQCPDRPLGHPLSCSLIIRSNYFSRSYPIPRKLSPPATKRLREYEDLKGRVEAFLGAKSQFTAKKAVETSVVQKTNSLATGIRDWCQDATCRFATRRSILGCSGSESPSAR